MLKAFSNSRFCVCRFHLLLEPLQVLADLGGGVAAEEFRERRARLASGRAVLQTHGYARAAVLWIVDVDTS